ncbi:TIMM10 [Cordylochernes scorpioides]|uniref:Mitochondrial import inner membrane translocase subunit n=1 Tax=Cordylochernes scorpioides TaxID=51811 RepID=A0ABY6JWK2_9ARAC|nr:TIMM10 [Cordylochernes scorpioides]
MSTSREGKEWYNDQEVGTWPDPNLVFSTVADLPLDASKMKLINDLEIEMMTDLYTRMSSSCQRKCISTRYKEGDLTKGEAVCLDRCVAKYFEVHDRIGQHLQTVTTQNQAIATPDNSKVQ